MKIKPRTCVHVQALFFLKKQEQKTNTQEKNVPIKFHRRMDCVLIVDAWCLTESGAIQIIVLLRKIVQPPTERLSMGPAHDCLSCVTSYFNNTTISTSVDFFILFGSTLFSY